MYKLALLGMLHGIKVALSYDTYWLLSDPKAEAISVYKWLYHFKVRTWCRGSVCAKYLCQRPSKFPSQTAPRCNFAIDEQNAYVAVCIYKQIRVSRSSRGYT